MLTCTKIFQDIPAAHRQYKHDGHCAQIHGHNWTIVVTFEASMLDENGFIVDFGKLDYLKDWVKRNLDHACLFSASDTQAISLVESYPSFFNVTFLPDVSCEGLVQYIHAEFNRLVRQHTDGRVSVRSITVYEDSKNYATYQDGE